MYERVITVLGLCLLCLSSSQSLSAERVQRRGTELPVQGKGVHLMVILATENKANKYVTRQMSLLHDLTMAECVQARGILLEQVPDAYTCCYPPTEGHGICQP
jgi:hypothetical protein